MKKKGIERIKKLCRLSSRANYTNQAISTCRRKLVPTFEDRGFHAVEIKKIEYNVNQWDMYFTNISEVCIILNTNPTTSIYKTWSVVHAMLCT
jgi:hypothetical protein